MQDGALRAGNGLFPFYGLACFEHATIIFPHLPGDLLWPHVEIRSPSPICHAEPLEQPIGINVTTVFVLYKCDGWGIVHKRLEAIIALAQSLLRQSALRDFILKLFIRS